MGGVNQGSHRSVQVVHLAEGQSSMGLHMGFLKVVTECRY